MTPKEEFGHYLSGLTDGEGTFSLMIKPRREPGLFKLSWRFVIGLREDDHLILREIFRYFGCGKLSKVPRNHPRPNEKPQMRFSIENVFDHVVATLPHFDRFPLRAKKSADYQVFRECVLFGNDVQNRVRKTPRGRRWMPADYERFRQFKERLEDVRRYKSPW